MTSKRDKGKEERLLACLHHARNPELQTLSATQSTTTMLLLLLPFVVHSLNPDSAQCDLLFLILFFFVVLMFEVLVVVIADSL